MKDLEVLFIGVLCLLVALIRWMQVRARVNWLLINAKIIKATVSGYGSGYRAPFSKIYYVEIKYQYQISGINYIKTTRVAIRDEFIPLHYRRGKKISVYYNPQDPLQSVASINRDNDAVLTSLLAGATVFVLVGAILFLFP